VNILIAEDDVLTRRTLEPPVTRRGHQVVIATEGTEARRALQSSDAPSLAVLDWMMPGLDGLELCRRVRATPRRTAAYLILLTARGGNEDIVRGLDAGANDYVTKPFKRNELRAGE